MVFFTNLAGDLGFASTDPEYDAHRMLISRNVITEPNRSDDTVSILAILPNYSSSHLNEVQILFKIPTFLISRLMVA